METIYLIEFNPKSERIHYEPLEGRLRKNASELIHERKLRSPNWVPVATAPANLAWEQSQIFLQAWRKKA